MALKLRRAKEKGVIPYPTRATSFKRSLGGALPPRPRAATCPDFVGITPHPDRRDSYRIGEACAVDLESHSERRNDNRVPLDRKSTRLNSSHSQISYAVFCLKKKKNIIRRQTTNTITNQLNAINPR